MMYDPMADLDAAMDAHAERQAQELDDYWLFCERLEAEAEAERPYWGRERETQRIADEIRAREITKEIMREGGWL